MRITVQHLRLQGIKYCASGTRGFFQRYNLDFRDFIKNGISSETLLKTGDPMARRIVEEAFKQENKKD